MNIFNIIKGALKADAPTVEHKTREPAPENDGTWFMAVNENGMTVKIKSTQAKVAYDEERRVNGMLASINNQLRLEKTKPEGGNEDHIKRLLNNQNKMRERLKEAREAKCELMRRLGIIKRAKKGFTESDRQNALIVEMRAMLTHKQWAEVKRRAHKKLEGVC